MRKVSREEARLKGLTRYYPGVACIRGHLCEWTVAGPCCTECARLSREGKLPPAKVYGVGYNSAKRGTGFLAKTPEGILREYDHWRRMLQRSYDPKWKTLHPTYGDCSVSPEWWDYQNFAKWYHKNEYRIEGADLDKDLLLVGNKEYCPELCVFIPEELNKAITIRGNVSRWHRRDLVYETYCCGVYLGRSDNPLTYAEKWVEFKIRHINQLADKYEGQLAPEAISALRSFTINVLDTGEVVRVR